MKTKSLRPIRQGIGARKRWSMLFEPLEPRWVLTAPVAVDDEFVTDEDTALFVGPERLSEADIVSDPDEQVGSGDTYLDMGTVAFATFPAGIRALAFGNDSWTIDLAPAAGQTLTEGHYTDAIPGGDETHPGLSAYRFASLSHGLNRRVHHPFIGILGRRDFARHLL